jgi:hypothetical protein
MSLPRVVLFLVLRSGGAIQFRQAPGAARAKPWDLTPTLLVYTNELIE